MTDTKTDTAPQQHWPATIVACVLIAAIAIIYAVSSPDQRSQLLAGAGIAGVALQSLMPAIRKFAGVPLVLLGALVAAPAIHGCGAAASDQQRHDYAIEAAHCMENEQAIADRPATTEAQDLADLAAEEARCDEARRAIEHPAVDGGV